MDNLTHTLVAATLARTPLARAGRGTLPALIVASNAPDADILAALAGGRVAYLEWHRGITHGLLGVVVLGVASAGLVSLGRLALDRARPAPRRHNASLGMLMAVSMIAVVLHILMDLPTSYGTRILSPFDWRWFSFDWLPIIDVYLLIALVAGLVFGELSKDARPRFAAIVLAVMAANYGGRAAVHQQALALAPRLLGPLLPPACDAVARGFGRADGHEPRGLSRAPFFAINEWPRAPVASATGRPCLIEIAAVPTFVSPFRWRVIAHLSNGYELHDLDVLDARFRAPASAGDVFWRRSVRYPDQWMPATFAAARTHTAATFLGFSRFPAARTFSDPQGGATVRWSDMRFVGGFLTVDAPSPPTLFNVFVRLDASGGVVQEQMGR